MAPGRPLITVVIPTRNRLKYLLEAVGSVQQQSYENWECIVVDDASTDGTADRVRAMVDGRIRLLVLRHHHERSGARNAGLAQSTGSYVLFLDDDDMLTKQALRRLLKAATRRRCAAAIGSLRRFTEDGMSRRQIVHPRVPWTGEVWRETVFGWQALPGMTLFARAALEHAGGWDEGISWTEDIDLLLRVSALGAFAFVPTTVLAYRLHATSTRANIKQADIIDVRGRYVATLPRDRSVKALQILEAGRAFDRAESAFRAMNLRQADTELRRALQLAPWVSRSFLLGPSVTALRAKLALGSLTGPAAIASLRGIRARGRSLLQRDPDRPEGH
jgi:glycosyltransferase involved in cell wall biosynthesis